MTQTLPELSESNRCGNSGEIERWSTAGPALCRLRLRQEKVYGVNVNPTDGSATIPYSGHDHVECPAPRWSAKLCRTMCLASASSSCRIIPEYHTGKAI